MTDEKIIGLYQERSEQAIKESDKKYNRYCYSIAYNILHNNEDSEECVNDTWLRAWNAIPPAKPSRLSAFFGKITRNLSLNKLKKLSADKRGSGETELILSELSQIISAQDNVIQQADANAIAQAINSFLSSLTPKKRKIFVRRYWYLSPVKEIAKEFDMGESQTKMLLMRLRNELKNHLIKEGFEI